MRLDQALVRLLPEYSRSRLQEWIRSGHVTMNGAPASAKAKVWGGETIVVAPQPAPGDTAHQPEDIPLQVVFEDDQILVIDKPAGLVVHPGSGNWRGTLLNALLRHAPQLSGVPRAGIVHRLDKDTSGLLVVAKTIPAQVDLMRQLQARSVTREYSAVVRGMMARDGVIEAPIGRHPVNRTRMAVVARGKSACSSAGGPGRCCAVALKPAARIRFACICTRSDIRWSAIRCIAPTIEAPPCLRRRWISPARRCTPPGSPSFIRRPAQR
jgi:23S rRNA pseudouridine1911/1915/1917 synthase